VRGGTTIGKGERKESIIRRCKNLHYTIRFVKGIRFHRGTSPLETSNNKGRLSRGNPQREKNKCAHSWVTPRQLSALISVSRQIELIILEARKGEDSYLYRGFEERGVRLRIG